VLVFATMVRDVPVASLSASELHEIDEDLATIEAAIRQAF
jgi:hypothetical protein